MNHDDKLDVEQIVSDLTRRIKNKEFDKIAQQEGPIGDAVRSRQVVALITLLVEKGIL